MITEHAKLLSDGRLLVFCRDSNHCDMALRLILMKTVKCQWCGKRRGTVEGSVLKDLTSVVGLRWKRVLYIHSPPTIPAGTETRTHNLWVTSSTL